MDKYIVVITNQDVCHICRGDGILHSKVAALSITKLDDVSYKLSGVTFEGSESLASNGDSNEQIIFGDKLKYVRLFSLAS